MKKTSFLLAFVVTLSFFVIGCSDKTGGTVPLSVKITLDGEPLSDATVMLAEVGKSGRMAAGSTDAKGVAVMKATEGWPGTFPGEYSVMVKKTTYSVGKNPGTAEVDRNADPNDNTFSLSKELLPKKYASPVTSGMKLLHEKKKGYFEFEISSK